MYKMCCILRGSNVKKIPLYTISLNETFRELARDGNLLNKNDASFYGVHVIGYITKKCIVESKNNHSCKQRILADLYFRQPRKSSPFLIIFE